ncbi:MAG: PA0069 family radical SAM protein [Alphaproteobacteria bacterium]|nr:PA0069 family radical SAM protein [Alphaproteobacteria bacterium]
MVDTLPDRAVKGRGALSNRVGRFERHTRHAIDDGWARPGVPAPDGADKSPAVDDETDPPSNPATIVSTDTTRTIIATNKSPDIPFDRSINPYRGCEHGCIYCFARPTHAYLGFSAGLDFETRILAKPDAAELLARELADRHYRCSAIAMGTNTDPYQPLEKNMQITRRILQVLAAHQHPVTIVTKSALIMRDIDILAPMAAKNLAHVSLSVTTLDRHLARVMEPRASTPMRRLTAIRTLAEAGIPTGVMTAPVIPGLNDSELENILKAAAAHGARSAGYVLLRLPLEIKELFEEWLRAHVPLRADRVMSLVRQTRDGALYQSQFGRRKVGSGAYADLVRQRFERAVTRFGLDRDGDELDTTLFRPPPRAGEQLNLL